MKDGQWLVVSAFAGIAIYYCEWIELLRPGTCNQDFDFTITRMYVLPVVLSGILGFICYKKPIYSWLLFMLPSWGVRLILLVNIKSNLSPLLLMINPDFPLAMVSNVYR